jgi:polyhydroxyalkanoate synthesis regulator phasin
MHLFLYLAYTPLECSKYRLNKYPMPTQVNMLVPITRGLKLWVGVIFIAIALFCSSCAQPPPPPQPPPPEPVQPSPQSVGEALFLNEDYANALLEFEHDYETALAPEDQNQALYGLACTQLMLAHSDSQLAEAIENLEKWDVEKGDAPHTENRHLLVTALKFQSELMQKKIHEQVHRAKQKNTVIANQRKMITEMASTVDNLQKQLEELEAIDETLQEKKKPI